MSSILKALKKLEEEKSLRQEVQVDIAREILAPPPRRLSGKSAALLAILAVAVLAVSGTWLAARSYFAIPGPTATVPVPPERPAPPAAEPAPQPVPAPPPPAAPAVPVPVANVPGAPTLSKVPAAPAAPVAKAPAVPVAKAPAVPVAKAPAVPVAKAPAAAGPGVLPAPTARPATPAPAPVPVPAPAQPAVAAPRPELDSGFAPPVQAAAPPAPKRPVLKIGGIAAQGGDRYAVVNGSLVREGESVAGARVEEILPDRVRFLFAGERFEAAIPAGRD